jgi:hypothetical protein
MLSCDQFWFQIRGSQTDRWHEPVWRRVAANLLADRLRLLDVLLLEP